MLAQKLSSKTAYTGTVVVLVGAAYLGFYFTQYRNFHLFGDDVAFFAGMVDGSWLSWVSTGYSRYFMIYPQWTQPFTNFIRPVGNFVFYLEYAIFGRHFGVTFLVFYGLIAANALLLRRVMIELRVPALLASLGGLVFLINPAIVNSGLLAFAFQSDVWAGFFVLGAFDAVLRRRFGIVLALLLLSAFTKEAALFAPIAAAASWFFLYGRRIEASVLLLPLLLWLAVRWLAFGSLGGAYAAPADLRSLIVGAVEGLVIWPLGADFELLHAGLLGTVPRDLRSLEPVARGDFRFVSQLFLVIGDLLLWILIATAALRAARFAISYLREARVPSTALQSSRDALIATTMIWFLGALAFGVLAGHEARLGACIYEFLIIFCTLILRPDHTPSSERISSLRWTAAAFICAAFLLHMVSWEREWRGRYAEIFRPESRLDQALRDLPAGSEKVYVIDGPFTYSAPLFLKDALALPLTVHYLNQFVGCDRAPSKVPELHGRLLTIRLPSCAQIIFPGADQSITAQGIGGTVERQGVGRYQFPNGKVTGHGIRNASEPRLDYGDVIAIDLQMKSSATLLYFDWGSGDYRILGTYQPSP